MKFFFAIVILVLFTAVGTAAAEVDVLDNPMNPLAAPTGKKIDRIVKPVEVLRISDSGSDYFLKKPSNILVDGDGSIFVMDMKLVQLLEFNKEGAFVKGLSLKGEGPGELRFLHSYWITDKEKVLGGFSKVLRFDNKGTLLKELFLSSNTLGYGFMTCFGGKYYFYTRPPIGDGLVTGEYQLVATDGNGKRVGEYFKVPVTSFSDTVLKKEKGKLHAETVYYEVTRYTYAVAGKFLYVTGDLRYLIRVFDLEKCKLVKTFRRKYIPVPFTPQSEKSFTNSDLFKKRSKVEFHRDVSMLLAAGDSVWVLTSTVDKDKGIQVDVFNPEGKYVDRFHLQVPNVTHPDDKGMRQLYYKGGFLYSLALDDDDNKIIVKYKLENL
ncbi:MAG: 6-bladed beta-propeller [bacterium]|nr:6-bladed beta-propeller [bacterium]